MAKIEIQHFDKLETEIFPGDYVAASYGRSEIMIARVVKLNPKMLTICRIGARSNCNVYPQATVKIDSTLVTMYMLKNRIG